MLDHTGSPPLLASLATRQARAVPDRSPVASTRILKGRSAILEAQPLLASLARRVGLAGEADALEYFLSAPDPLRKSPCLVLIGGSGGGPMTDRDGEDVQSAVLLFEYRTRLRGTRVFSSADSTGRRNVLAPPGDRARVAAFAGRRLIASGAQIVRIAFSETHRGNNAAPELREDVPSPGQSVLAIEHEFRHAGGKRGRHGSWTFDEQEMPLYLPLLSSFNETLARIGQRTRSNLRYYRRRAEQEFGCSFVPEVQVSREEFLRYNAECTYAVSEELAGWRYEALRTLPGCKLSGVRDRDGRWLSMVGLRRNGSFAEIDWQMNRAHLPAASLATVMRSYLIEHEVELGTERLYIEGGTPQPIRLSFEKERVGELIVKKRSLYVGALERSASRIFPPKNRLAHCLGNPAIEWKAW